MRVKKLTHMRKCIQFTEFCKAKVLIFRDNQMNSSN